MSLLDLWILTYLSLNCMPCGRGRFGGTLWEVKEKQRPQEKHTGSQETFALSSPLPGTC